MPPKKVEKKQAGPYDDIKIVPLNPLKFGGIDGTATSAAKKKKKKKKGGAGAAVSNNKVESEKSAGGEEEEEEEENGDSSLPQQQQQEPKSEKSEKEKKGKNSGSSGSSGSGSSSSSSGSSGSSGRRPRSGLTLAVNERQEHFSFFIAHNPGDPLGRRAIANKDLEAGSLVLREVGFPWVVKMDYEQAVCHNCTKSLDGLLELGGGTSCAECRHAFYCSATCAQQHLPAHTPQCKALTVVNDIAKLTGVAVDLLRVVIAFLTEVVQRKAPSLITAENFWPDLQNVMEMETHMTMEDVKRCKEGVENLLSVMPPEFNGSSAGLDVNEVVGMIGRINANAHGLVLDPTHTSHQYGLGLFPLCALFNHSCYPNTLFVNEGSRLVFRTIRPVKQGDELCVNYVGLNQHRNNRRVDLKISKNFLCFCRRCSLKPIDAEEQRVFANDQFLQALKCTRYGCDGYMTDTQLSQHILSESSSPWVCTECGTTAPWTEIRDREGDAKRQIEELLKTVGGKDAVPSKDLNRLNTLSNKLSTVLHPGHELWLNVELTKVQSAGAAGDLQARLTALRTAIALSERVFPANFLPCASYYRVLDKTLQNAINNTSAKPLIQRYKKEQQQARENFTRIYRICCGRDPSL